HAAMKPAVDAFLDPEGGPLVELGQAGGCSGGGTLLQEPLLHVPDGALHLALPLGVSGLTGPELGPMELGERCCWRMQREPTPLGLAEGSHPVGATYLGHPADALEESDQGLQGVLPVDGAGEPPDAHPRPTQHALEAVDLAEAPFPRPVTDLGPVELALLARGGHDRSGWRRCG